MTTPAKKPAAPRAAAAKTTARTAAARPAARTAARATAAKAPARAAVVAPAAAAPEYNFTKPYKMLTGLDDAAFCDKVSAHLNAGYKLAGAATMTAVGARVFVGQAVIKESNIVKPKAKAKAKGKKK